MTIPTAWREAVARAMAEYIGKPFAWANYEGRADAAIRALLPLVVERCAKVCDGWRESDWPEGVSRFAVCYVAEDRADAIRALTKELSDGQ